ncbi:MAG TPA: hypothetical protein VGB55_15670 [Tepidisphaeraceae bacterium]|jgi:hypothetical protein
MSDSGNDAQPFDLAADSVELSDAPQLDPNDFALGSSSAASPPSTDTPLAPPKPESSKRTPSAVSAAALNARLFDALVATAPARPRPVASPTPAPVDLTPPIEPAAVITNEPVAPVAEAAADSASPMPSEPHPIYAGVDALEFLDSNEADIAFAPADEVEVPLPPVVIAAEPVVVTSLDAVAAVEPVTVGRPPVVNEPAVFQPAPAPVAPPPAAKPAEAINLRVLAQAMAAPQAAVSPSVVPSIPTDEAVEDPIAMLDAAVDEVADEEELEDESDEVEEVEQVVATDPEPAVLQGSTGAWWTLPTLFVGLSVVACAVLVPAADENRQALHELAKIEQEVAYFQKQSEVNKQFLEHVANDPALAERLAMRQLRMTRSESRMIHLPQRKDGFAMSPFALVHVDPPAPLPEYRSVGGLLGRWFNDTRRQIYFAGAGLLIAAAGVILGGRDETEGLKSE